MQKVKLTQEQADTVEENTADKETAIRLHVGGSWLAPVNKCLNKLTLDELVRALYIGYEVEEEYKEDDWVVLKDGNIVRIYYVKNGVYSSNVVGYPKGKVFAYDLGGDYWYDYEEIERHATPEEIAQEKERRWWEKHGREVREIKVGDILYDNRSHDFFMATNNHYLTKKSKYELICFKDDRKDV